MATEQPMIALTRDETIDMIAENLVYLTFVCMRDICDHLMSMRPKWKDRALIAAITEDASAGEIYVICSLMAQNSALTRDVRWLAPVSSDLRVGDKFYFVEQARLSL
jgi:hypothetical protein